MKYRPKGEESIKLFQQTFPLEHPPMSTRLFLRSSPEYSFFPPSPSLSSFLSLVFFIGKKIRTMSKQVEITVILARVRHEVGIIHNRFHLVTYSEGWKARFFQIFFFLHRVVLVCNSSACKRDMYLFERLTIHIIRIVAVVAKRRILIKDWLGEMERTRRVRLFSSYFEIAVTTKMLQESWRNLQLWKKLCKN